MATCQNLCLFLSQYHLLVQQIRAVSVMVVSAKQTHHRVIRTKNFDVELVSRMSYLSVTPYEWSVPFGVAESDAVDALLKSDD